MGASVSDNASPSGKQSDLLLWLAGALVAGVGVTWLVISAPWSSSSGPESADAPAAAEPTPAAAPAAAPQRGEARTDLETSLDDNPLRMAQLAYEAGMLVEPEEYSAWTLYRRAIEREPDNAEAKQGLEKIAQELLRRAGAAVEQGRFDDARKAVNRIRKALPDDPDANELAARLDELTPKQIVAAAPTRGESGAGESGAEQGKQKKPEAPKPAAPKVDPVVEAHDGFAAAMAANRLLTPAESSAKHFVGVLASIAPDAAPTKEARKQLFARLLARADESLADTDTDAATTWIDEAEGLEVDASAVAAERQKLTDQLVKVESARRLPASEFKVVSYIAPIYPQRALEKEISGWVDVEFTVARDGTTREIAVTGASNDRYFKDEAIAAVSKWRFEPRVFMNQTIEQRAYTRIRFDFQG
jgi:TonB family protein